MYDAFSIHRQASLHINDTVYNATDLNCMVATVRHHLEDNHKNAPVGIAMQSSIWLIPTIIACLQMQMPYIPLDVNGPTLRTETILRDCRAWEIVLCDRHLVLPNGYASILLEGQPSMLFDTHKVTTQNRSETAYIMYTSGTTGVPKGVEIYRSALLNFMLGMEERLDIHERQHIACLTNPTFDIFFLESVFALHLGMAVHLADLSTLSSIRKLCKWIQREHIEVLQITPTRLQQIMLVDIDLVCLQQLHILLLGGEPLSIETLQHVQNRLSARIYNLYGPTETTIWSSVAELTNSNNVNIGQPIRETLFLVLSDDLKEVPPGAIGELCIAGQGLAKGYIHDSPGTQYAFPYLENGLRIYRTGDYARQISPFTYTCLGRKDRQIKLRGHRIELDEIEHCISQYPGVIQAMCGFDKSRGIIVAGYTATKQIDTSTMRTYLLLLLPEYMIPTLIKQYDLLPLTSSGKIDIQHAMISLSREEL